MTNQDISSHQSVLIVFPIVIENFAIDVLVFLQPLKHFGLLVVAKLGHIRRVIYVAKPIVQIFTNDRQHDQLSKIFQSGVRIVVQIQRIVTVEILNKNVVPISFHHIHIIGDTHYKIVIFQIHSAINRVNLAFAIRKHQKSEIYADLSTKRCNSIWVHRIVVAVDLDEIVDNVLSRRLGVIVRNDLEKLVRSRTSWIVYKNLSHILHVSVMINQLPII